MSSSIKLGRLGEKIAARYLLGKGYVIAQANYKIRDGEIDLICQQVGKLVFVEVKTRTNRSFGWPEEAFTKRKKEKFIKTIARYLTDNDYQGAWQIDVIAILLSLDKKTAQLKHYRAWDQQDY